MLAPDFAFRPLQHLGAGRPKRIGAVALLALASALPLPASAQSDLAPASNTECVSGGSCLVDVTIENRGDLAFDGATGLRGVFDPAVTVESVSGETRGLKCEVTGEGAYECVGSKLSVRAGEAAGIQVVIDIPAGFDRPAISHRTELVWPDGTAETGDTDNDRNVSEITVIDPAMLPAADLGMTNVPVESACMAGQPCGFTLTVTNNGPAIFDGTIEISNSTDLLATKQLSSSPDDWSCAGSGERTVCTLPGVVLPVGETRSLVLTLTTASILRGPLADCAEVRRDMPANVRDIQRMLNELGYDAGLVDGIPGRRTRAAIGAYQEANDLPATGRIDRELTDNLFGTDRPSDTVPANDRACATVQLLAPH